jgi:hypothetical protein
MPILKPICLQLCQSATNPDVFERSGDLQIRHIDPQERKLFMPTQIYVTRTAGDIPTTNPEQIAFRLILGFGIRFMESLPQHEGGYIVPGAPGVPIIIVLEHRGHVLVSAGCVNGRPWCHAMLWNPSDGNQDESIHQMLCSWRKDYNPEPHFHEDRVVLNYSYFQDSSSETWDVELHAGVKRCPGKHTVNNRKYVMYSLQVSVIDHSPTGLEGNLETVLGGYPPPVV